LSNEAIDATEANKANKADKAEADDAVEAIVANEAAVGCYKLPLGQAHVCLAEW
jgi:hypothetical protein